MSSGGDGVVEELAVGAFDDDVVGGRVDDGGRLSDGGHVLTARLRVAGRICGCEC